MNKMFNLVSSAGWPLIVLFFLSGSLMATGHEDQVLAFPGAEGFGKYTTGGRGGKVLIVSNLEDDGPGSLRDAIEKDFPRIIVFAVSGTIPLESELKIAHGDLTIAGQTAPGDGICLKNYSTLINADNVIIRFMRFRMGDERKFEGDAISGLRHNNIIVDHCSMSWGTDEVATFYDNENFTLQWCLIAEGLNESVHHKGAHGYGGIWGGMGASFHHNLLANNSSRNPRFCGSRYHKQPDKEVVDFRNNVIYNWGINSSYAGEEGKHNMVNNYYKPGPGTRKTVSHRILNPFEPYGKFYLDGNVMVGSEKVTQNNWAGGVQCDDPAATRSEDPFQVVPVKMQSAEEAFPVVLKYSGASLRRDQVDARVVEEVKNGTVDFKGSKGGIPGIPDSQKDAGGWPVLISKPAPADKDKDGMPDEWEKQNGLDPNDPADATAKTLDANYDNIEVYLNGLVAEITKGELGD